MADQFDLGRHEAQIEQLANDMVEVKGDVSWIKQHLAEKKGERRVAVWAAGFIGAGVMPALGFIARKLGITP